MVPLALDVLFPPFHPSFFPSSLPILPPSLPPFLPLLPWPCSPCVERTSLRPRREPGRGAVKACACHVTHSCEISRGKPTISRRMGRKWENSGWRCGTKRTPWGYIDIQKSSSLRQSWVPEQSLPQKSHAIAMHAPFPMPLQGRQRR